MKASPCWTTSILSLVILASLGCSNPGDGFEFVASTRVNCDFTRPTGVDAPGACISYNFGAVKQAVDAARAAVANGTAQPHQKALLDNQSKCGAGTEGEEQFCIACTWQDGSETGACKNGKTNDP